MTPEKSLLTHQIPGAVFGFLHGSRERVHAAGQTHAEAARGAVETDMLFHIGSTAKILTSLLVAYHAGQGLLSLDMPVRHYLPELGAAKCGEATLVEMLNHTGGFPGPQDYFAASSLALTLSSGLLLPTEQRMVVARNIAGMKGVLAPGTMFKYSNLGYAMAGRVLDVVLGVPWEEAVVEHVTKPLEMRSVGFGSPCADGQNEPWGHTEGPDGAAVPQKTPWDNPTALAPAGGIHCTLEDVLKLAALFFDQGRFELLKTEPRLAKRALGPSRLESYGGGWRYNARDWAAGPALYSLGSNTAYTCALWVAPLKQAAFACLCNKGGASAIRFTDEIITQQIREAGLL